MSGIDQCSPCSTAYGSGPHGGETPTVSMINVGDGFEFYVSGSGPDPFQIRTMTSVGETISVSYGTDTVNIEFPLVNLGTPIMDGCAVWDGGYGPVGLKRIYADPSEGISVSCESDRIRITNLLPGTDVTLASAGGTESLVNDGIGPSLSTKGLTPGIGISLTGAATSVTIDNADPGSNVTLASAGGTESLVNDGIGPLLAIKGLTPGGPGLILVDGAVDITVINSEPASLVTLASAGGTQTLVNDGSGPALATKGLTPGTGISMSATATAVTVTNSDLGSAVTLASAGGTESLVNDGVGPTLATKGLTAGTGISLSGAATAVTVAATLSSGSEIVANVNGSDVGTSTRLSTIRGTQVMQTQVRVNIAAGTQDVKLRWRSVTNGQTTNVTNRNVMAQSTLGSNLEVPANTSQNTSSSTFSDVPNTTLTLNAGDWIVSWSLQITVPNT